MLRKVANIHWKYCGFKDTLEKLCCWFPHLFWGWVASIRPSHWSTLHSHLKRCFLSCSWYIRLGFTVAMGKWCFMFRVCVCCCTQNKKHYFPDRTFQIMYRFMYRKNKDIHFRKLPPWIANEVLIFLSETISFNLKFFQIHKNTDVFN